MNSPTKRSTDAWAEHEFGNAELGDARRTKRLVAVAAAAANKPAGHVTEVMEDAAEREGAYRFLEAEPSEMALLRSSAFACAARAGDRSLVLAVGDETALSITGNPTHRTGLGPVGARSGSGFGLRVFSMTAYGFEGLPLGLLDQRYYARSMEVDGRSKSKKKQRPANEKETWHVVQSIKHTADLWREAGGTGKLCYVIDRGGDFQEALKAAKKTGHSFVIRAAQDRCVAPSKDSAERYLWGALEAQPVAGSYDLDVPASHGRKAREATIDLRYREVELQLRAPGKKATPLKVYAVLASGRGTAPEGEEPIEWMLLTNLEVASVNDARFVIQIYSKRWRCEDFHKVWKVTCKVEQSQLEDGARIGAWATILAAVAMRILRLTHLARCSPDAPATEELTATEIEALIRLRRPKNVAIDDNVTMKQAVLWIAELGGYVGRSSGGPPGPKTLGRGLAKLEIAAQVLS